MGTYEERGLIEDGMTWGLGPPLSPILSLPAPTFVYSYLIVSHHRTIRNSITAPRPSLLYYSSPFATSAISLCITIGANKAKLLVYSGEILPFEIMEISCSGSGTL